jgi:hypothetical protein
MGALIATPYDIIEKESNLTPLSTLITRADLRLYLAIRNRPQLYLLDTALDKIIDPLNEDMETSYLYDIGMQPFLNGFLDDDFDAADILEKFPAKKRRRARISYRNEVILARFRMGFLPSRQWATRVGLSENPLCRHCGGTEETSSHLFQCQFVPFPDQLDKYSFVSLKDISKALSQESDTFQLENDILRYVASNNLFRLGNSEDDPPGITIDSIEKRKIHISPSPSRPRKRQARNSLKRKRETPPEPRAQRPRLYGPAGLFKQMRRSS